MNKGKVYRVDYARKHAQISEEIMDAIGEWPEYIWKFMITPVGCVNDKLVFHTLWDRHFIEFDMNSGMVRKYLCIIDDKEYERRWWNNRNKNNPVISEKEYTLEDFIRII
jgi:hypothetical protein